ncbi:MAG TPA: CheB methylesterase domain-containing protein, partial [Kofleriaceae bacterium]
RPASPPTSPPLLAAQAHASASAAASSLGLPARPSPLPARPRSASAPLVVPGQFKLPRATGPRPPLEIVAIGASTGGPNALAVLLGQLPADLPVPVVIVQHMLSTFTRHFAERLGAQCALAIVEADAGEALRPGVAYIARGDFHLTIERRAGKPFAQLNQDKLENFCRPAVDVLFRSVAQAYGAGALGVVLTGMGHDGLLGCGAIREAGGDVIVQDEATSVVWGMPGYVARAGLASQVLPLDHLGPEVRRRIQLAGARLAGTAT